MLTRYIWINMKRSAVTNALFSMLLILAGALFTLSAGLWYSVYRSEKDLEDIVTTIAVPDMYAIRRYVRNQAAGNLSAFSNEEGSPLSSLRSNFDSTERYQEYVTFQIYRNVMERISGNVYNSGVVHMDDRRIYGAFSPDIRAVPYRITEYGYSDLFVQNSPQSVAAFVVQCVGLEAVFDLQWIQGKPFLIRSIVADFRVEQDVYVNEGRHRTMTVTGYFPFINPDGSFPVEEGKRYLVVGYDYAQGGDMSTVNPSWYNDLPGNRNIPNGLYMDIISANFSFVETETANTIRDISENIRPVMRRNGILDQDFPISIIDRIPQFDEGLGFEGYTWFELSGSLEEALASEHGQYITAALSVAEISHNSLTVMTTEDINSLLRFNQRTNRITEGRAISASETLNGTRVCLVSEHLAKLNSLSVGDKLSMQMYNTVLGQIPISGNVSAWVPNPYHPGMDISGSLEYEIVGVFSGLTQEMNDHAISPNTVIVPSGSFGGITGIPMVRLDAQYNPPLLDTIIVPNDKIEETKAQIEVIAEGYSSFFRFYDQGYTTFKPVLVNLRTSMTWIAILAAIGWAIAVLVFLLFYVGRKSRETALLTGLGVSKTKSFRWVFTQCATIIILAQGLVLVVVSLFFRRILDTAISVSASFTAGYRNFTLSEMEITGGLQIELPLNATPYGLVLAAVGMAALLLGLSAFLSARAAKRRWASRSAGE